MGRTWAPQPVATTSSGLLWVTLLCLAPAIRSNGPPRAVLTLEPPWLDLLREDNVTLICEGFQTPGQDSTEWFHNGSSLSIHQDSYFIPAVNIKDSGEYQCRTKQAALSNSVKLQVSSDWLLLQVEKLEFEEGDTMILRCHSWKSKPLHKVTYYHNDEALKYQYQSFNYVVSKVNYTHSGSYACTGVMGHTSHVSATVVITVRGEKLSTVNVVAITLVLVVVIAIIAVVALYYYKRRKETALPDSPKSREQGENLPEEPIHTPQETRGIEVENSMSYSLLKHTDNPEEEVSGQSTYQNR